MNATDSLLTPLSDAGCLSGLKHGALGARYRFWRDTDGTRHVFSVYPADAAPDYPDAVAIVARRTPAGSIAMWVGPAGEVARQAAQRLDAEEIHIHVLGEDEQAEGLRRYLNRPAPQPRTVDARAGEGRPRGSEGRARFAGLLPAPCGGRHAA
ncbi:MULTISPECIES: hypothetical protein [unclassified Xanthobacter]|uniref:hypothetical protein n=1 Tax=unclassified Xanthobacter TaxID=2623496 RepID=UPI001EDF7F8C|nr:MULTISPECIES: hypothetical protein [unclassified Xanthobacter]